MKRLTICLFSIISWTISAQSDSDWLKAPTVKISAFVDAYYVYDFANPKGNSRQGFFYNHNRHNDFSINLGLIKLTAEQTKYRGNLGVQVGTYVTDNYASEPNALKNIHEANVGLSISKKNRVWIDMGVLPSYIGFESAISTENPTLTRSFIAESSPYFVSGAKLTFKPNSNWEMAGLVMNGWQRIQRLPGNSLPAFGTQVQFTPSEKFSLNWSTFAGTNFPDQLRRMRYFNNLYAKFKVKERVDFFVGIDYGVQQRAKQSTIYEYWLGLDAIAQIKLTDKWSTSLRAEYYLDEYGIIIPKYSPNGFATFASSINFDYSPVENLKWRIEARWMNSPDKIFFYDSQKSYNNVFISTSLAINLGKELK